MKMNILRRWSKEPEKPVRNVRKGSTTKSPDSSAKRKQSLKEEKDDLALDFKLFNFKERWEDESTRSIVGILTISFSLYLGWSIVNSFQYGLEDMLAVLSPDSDTDLAANNQGGKLGAYIGYYFVRYSFGFGTLVIPFITFLLGVRWFTGKNLLPLGKSIYWALAAMVFLPLTWFCLFMPELGAYDFFTGNTTRYIHKLLFDYLGWAAPASALIAVYLMALTIITPGWQHKVLIRENILKIVTRVKGFFINNNVNDLDLDDEGTAQNTFKNSDEEDEESNLDEIVDDFLDGPSDEAQVNPEKPIVNNTDNDDDGEDGKGEGDLTLGIKETEEEETLSKKEQSNLSQEFGEYDPTLDLGRYDRPSAKYLIDHGDGANKVSDEELEINKDKILDTLKNFKIDVDEINATVGPTVTLYEIIPAPGVRISKIKNLEDDIALSLSALGIRIIAPIPGKGTIGIEVPNSKPDVVSMKALIESKVFQEADMELPIALGKTISNQTHVFDLAKMPHLLMAGATGQGKSVGLNAMLVSLLYKKHPSQLKFVLIDPKKVELSVYTQISRHFLAQLPEAQDPIITDTDKVVATLNSLCMEMDQRYDLLKDAQCRNIKEYNDKFKQRKIIPGEEKELFPERGHHYLPYIVLVIDEFADLIMTAGKEVETPIARLAQLARAIGIHLIIATQRPSVNIITGTIKANFPARVAFRVTAKIDSRTILDAGGADQLIGRGDMLMSTGNELIRLQCGFVDTPEVEKICEHIGYQQGYGEVYELPNYVAEGGSTERGATNVEERDVLFEEAARMIVMHQQGSTSMLQRKLKLGYNRAGRLVDQLEEAGVVGPSEGSKARKVLIPDDYSLDQLLHRPFPGDETKAEAQPETPRENINTPPTEDTNNDDDINN